MKYFSEGLIPDFYIEEAFKRLLKIKSGTINEAFYKISEEMADEFREDYYDYLYHLEPYVNSVIRTNLSSHITLWESVRIAVEDYYYDVFRDNIYTYADDIVEQCLMENGLSKPQIDAMNIRWLVSYVDGNTSIRRLRKLAKKQLPKAD